PSIVYPLSDGRTVGASLKVRGDIFAIQFPHPTQTGKYVEISTGCDKISDAHVAGAKIILKHYSPTIAPDPKTATWETIVADLEADADLRPRSLEVYTSTLGMFREAVPLSKGPADVTVEVAKAFTRKYATEGFKRSKKSDAKVYPRSKKTVENAVRRMSGLWSRLTPKYVITNPWEQVTRPTVPKRVPVIPTEDDVTGFFKWLEEKHPGWMLPKLFVEVKALSGCRLHDLCHIRSVQLDSKAGTLTIRPDQDKTHRERIIPLPADLCLALDQNKGPVYLWERYLEESKVHRPATRTKHREEFSPDLMYNGMKNIFREYAEAGGKLRSHGLRKRAITLTALATQNVDQTAEAIGIDPATARKYYLDAKAAFNGTDVMKKMAGVLRPQNGHQNSAGNSGGQSNSGGILGDLTIPTL
ncbi:MAG TPA: site-specific integrase, partial [Urbifossiella sp.]|nr:site-specific integrase [Urbifossiella sp.]